MALIGRMHEVKFKPFVNEGVRTFTFPPEVIAAMPHLEPSYSAGEDTDPKLTLEIKVKKYPALEDDDDDESRSARRYHGSGVWALSEASFESQKILPLELTTHDDTSDLKSWSVEKPLVQLWLYKNWVYSSDIHEPLRAEDVRALLNVEANRRRLVLEKAHALQAVADNYERPKRRAAIPQAVRVEVWQRDSGRCVECTSREKLEFDHIIPVAMGGGNTSRNLQLLCETCNRRKGASLG